ncbi:FAD-binding oxidoreductase [Streptomyces sp. NPDC049099]|uniref:FAD-binding oxidoreductase n=1 Tax=Streptomyces sp. NPDC049099 TaxID=3155768 RepID=UPI0034340A6D
MSDRVLLTGWGRTAPSAATVVRPGDLHGLRKVLSSRPGRGVVARGLGRSYGDAAQNAGGVVVDMTGLARILRIDAQAGTVMCEAGVSLHQLMHVLVPLGWFLPVTPGTRQVTVGGAIACDVHGKNHPAGGGFAHHVQALDLLQADGTVRTVTPHDDPSAFWATTGGMGLTGIVLRATIRLLPIETAWMRADTDRCSDLDALLSLMTQPSPHPYMVAWLAPEGRLGRSVLERGTHATRDLLPPARTACPLRLRTRPQVPVPRGVTMDLFGRAPLAALAEIRFRRAPRRRRGRLTPLSAFFHPLDAVTDWNRLYGRACLVQHQCVVPDGQEDTLAKILQAVRRHRAPLTLCVLKRLGPGSPGHLSFPQQGWTLALDFPASAPGLEVLLDRLDAHVLEAGGRVYLAKDSRMAPTAAALMYPRISEFRDVRARLDPHGVFRSDLARRLGL